MIFIMITNKKHYRSATSRKILAILKKSLPMRSNPMPRHGRGIAAINMK